MNRRTKRKFRAVCYYLLCWFVVGLCIALLEAFGIHDSLSGERVVLITQFAIFMGLSHGIYDVIILNDEMECRPVWLTLFIRTFYFISAICANLCLCILIRTIKAEEGLISEDSLLAIKETIANPEVISHVILFFVAANLFTFIRSVHKKFGRRAFWNTLLGKSQEPIEEDRIFMFIDLRHSTALAEELGHVTYSSFLKDYYNLLSNCCEENQGEIYQIAGDGAYLTWKISSCKNTAKPIDCFFDFTECLKNYQEKFTRKYGVRPEFKAGAHCGKVIATEVGNFGSELAYHGDVLNTTSRIQDQCSKLGQKFLISEKLYNVLPKPLPHGFLSKKEGFFELKGKKHEILLFSLQKPLTTLGD